MGNRKPTHAGPDLNNKSQSSRQRHRGGRETKIEANPCNSTPTVAAGKPDQGDPATKAPAPASPRNSRELHSWPHRHAVGPNPSERLAVGAANSSKSSTAHAEPHHDEWGVSSANRSRASSNVNLRVQCRHFRKARAQNCCTVRHMIALESSSYKQKLTLVLGGTAPGSAMATATSRRGGRPLQLAGCRRVSPHRRPQASP
jgi:hypothetical protein